MVMARSVFGKTQRNKHFLFHEPFASPSHLSYPTSPTHPFGRQKIKVLSSANNRKHLVHPLLHSLRLHCLLSNFGPRLCGICLFDVVSSQQPHSHTHLNSLSIPLPLNTQPLRPMCMCISLLKHFNIHLQPAVWYMKKVSCSFSFVLRSAVWVCYMIDLLREVRLV